MCTVSWVHSAEAEGYDLYFSRDEARTRGPERPPLEFESEGVRYLAPTDSDAGGTWVCVNEFGLALGLLNGYGDTSPRPPAISRGRLVRELAPCASPAQALGRLTAESLRPYQPLVLLAMGPERPAQLLRWNGQDLEWLRDADGLVPLSSSGVDPGQAQERRSSLLAASRAACPDDPRAALLDFHRGGGVEPDATSACMSREEAETRSLVHVSVGPGALSMAHAPGRPDRTPLAPSLRLARRNPR